MQGRETKLYTTNTYLPCRQVDVVYGLVDRSHATPAKTPLLLTRAGIWYDLDLTEREVNLSRHKSALFATLKYLYLELNSQECDMHICMHASRQKGAAEAKIYGLLAAHCHRRSSMFTWHVRLCNAIRLHCLFCFMRKLTMFDLIGLWLFETCTYAISTLNIYLWCNVERCIFNWHMQVWALILYYCSQF